MTASMIARSASADRGRLLGLHRAAQSLSTPIDPRDAIGPYLRDVADTFDARGTALVLREEEGLVIHRLVGGAEGEIEVVRERVHVKEVEYVPDAGGRGAVRVEVPEERRAIACLDRAALEALVEVGSRVERAFGSHQDVEWAIAREHELTDGLFVLQSRPVTGLPERPSTPENATAMALVMSMFGVGKAEE